MKRKVLFIPVTAIYIKSHPSFLVRLMSIILVFFVLFGIFRDLSHNHLDLGSENVFPHLESLMDLYVLYKFDKLSSLTETS